MMTLTATYSPEDNKLRLYASSRLPRELYDRLKAAGFKWAPKQDLFVAPMWTPAREDLCLDLCGEIGDEDTSLAERAMERADRFDDYSEKRAGEAAATRDAVDNLANAIPLGQPILVGHHSERRARKDAERIETGMRKQIRLWETAQYWQRRAEGALHHAAYKEKDEVRARRIKGLETDQRRAQKSVEEAETHIRLWTKIAAVEDPENQRRLALGLASHRSCHWDTWRALERGEMSAADAVAGAIAFNQDIVAVSNRWLAHLANRLAYERVLLGRAPDEATPKVVRKSAKASSPLLNYRGIVTVKGYWRGETEQLATRDMTKAEWAKKHADYKGTRWAADGSHRIRVAIFNDGGRSGYEAVFITDSKAHPTPAGVLPLKDEPKPEAEDPGVAKAFAAAERGRVINILALAP